MKKILLSFLFLVLTSWAQGQWVKSLGLKSGVSMANQSWNLISANRALDTEWRNGYYGAVSLEFLKSKHLSLTTDLGYYAKGNIQNIPIATIQMPEGDGTFRTVDTRFDYLLINPMLRIRHETGRIVPYALLGFRMDYQLSYQSDLNLQPIENDFRKTLWGGNLGAGLEYKTKQFGLLLEGQYHIDFTDLVNIPPSGTNAGVEVENRAFVWCIGLRYYLPQ